MTHPLAPPPFDTPLEAALWWIRMVSVVPLAPVLSNGPRPLVRWKEDGPLRTEVEVREFWAKNPRAQLAIVLGPTTDCRFLGAVDTDLKNRRDGMPEPPTGYSTGYRHSTKSGGTHDLFLYRTQPPETVTRRAIGVGGFVDVLLDGLLVVPPTNFDGAGEYRMVREGEIMEFEAVGLALDLAAPWLRHAWKNHRSKSAPAGRPDDKEPTFEGARRSVLLSRAGKLRNLGVGEEAILADLREFNERRCAPPLADAELAALARDVARRYEPPREPPATPVRPLWLTDERGKEKPDRAAFVEKVMLEFRFLATEDNDDLFYYRDGFYSPRAKTRVRKWAEDQFRARGETSSSSFTTEIIGGITRRSGVERTVFNPAGKLCIENGILDLETLTVSPHDPSVPFTYRLPVAFDPGATCPTFERFISEVVPDAGEREKLHRLFGYCLEPGNPYQSAFLVVGAGNNGKTTALCLLRDLLGSESVSGETLQSLCEGRFGTYSLWGKLANICTDIPASPIRYTGTFKMLTGGEDSVRAERKFTDAFFFTNPAKLVFSANELPPVESDRSYAFWRRWVTVDFPVDLTGSEDRDLPAKLRAELPGVFNWAIEGLRRLRAARGFPTSPGGLKEEWRRRSEPLYWFVSERVNIGASEEVLKADLYQAYAEFAADRNLPPLEPDRMGSLLPKYIPSVRVVKHRVQGKLERFWAGVGLQPNGDPPASVASPASVRPLDGQSEATEAGEAGGPLLGWALRDPTPSSEARVRAAARSAFDEAIREEGGRP